ncbi:hypothetical protein SLEP1_g46983 [Rubroshorea leprosula]|uniref:Uncharacterized protein n=1 Tax=Rubroshorea leprosula TaxID=152421 RepID=A0AAV5LNZ0_9ROSI|nr:hypothetical protein SLEP1_g46983 [Rubroshorea leprosula]
MIWAADFDESLAYNLEENHLEALIIELPRDSGSEMKEEGTEYGNSSLKGTLQSNQGTGEHWIPDNYGIKSASTYHFCGLTRSFWSKNEHLQTCSIILTGNGDDEQPVFCVAAVLIKNCHKIVKETHSIDDMIKIFNDKLLKIRVKSAYKQQSKSRKILFQANQGAEFYGFLFQVGPCHFLPILVEMAVGAILWSLESLLRTWHEKIWLPLIFND